MVRWVLICLMMFRCVIGRMRKWGGLFSSGVMGGVPDGSFDLGGVVPRWQIVTFLFRASRLVGGSVGDEGLLGSDSFSDVSVGHEADGEIGWAVSSGITQGVGGGRFGPDGFGDAGADCDVFVSVDWFGGWVGG